MVLDDAEPRLDGIRVAVVWPLDAVELFLPGDASHALLIDRPLVLIQDRDESVLGGARIRREAAEMKLRHVVLVHSVALGHLPTALQDVREVLEQRNAYPIRRMV